MWQDKVIEQNMKIDIKHPMHSCLISLLPNNSLFIYKNELYVKMHDSTNTTEACIISENNLAESRKSFKKSVTVLPVKQITVEY